jgi:hypothetical protein
MSPACIMCLAVSAPFVYIFSCHSDHEDTPQQQGTTSLFDDASIADPDDHDEADAVPDDAPLSLGN